MLDFDTLIAPIGREKFLRDHWNVSFARMKGTPGRFADLIDWEELNAILANQRLTAPRLRLYKDGKAIDPARYTTPAALGPQRVDSGGLAVALAEGATLVLTDAQDASAKLRALMQVFQEVLHTGAFVNLYAAWHPQSAFNLHWDPQDTIILQVSGRKRWKVYKPTRLHPLEFDLETPEEPKGEPVWSGILNDGDALYVPRGWWHSVVALNEPSLHLSVSITPPKCLDFLARAITKLRSETVVRADLAALKDKDTRAAQIRALHAALVSALSEDAMDEFLRQWEGDISHAPHIDLLGAAYGQFSTIDSNTRLRLASLHRLTLVPYGDIFEFKAANRMWTVPRALAPALSRLQNAHATSVAELTALLPSDADREILLKSLAVLARSGVVLIDRQP